jgi:hypothetical protein
LSAVTRLTDDLEIPFTLNEELQTLPHGLVVIDRKMRTHFVIAAIKSGMREWGRQAALVMARMRSMMECSRR